jgi:hypothetical protein
VKLSAKVASPAGCTPCDFRRGFPLGEGFNERERAFAESIPALGEGPESCSEQTMILKNSAQTWEDHSISGMVEIGACLSRGTERGGRIA